MKKKLLWLLSLCCVVGSSYAQTVELNMQKYWKFRNELRESFTKIGPNPGESLVARKIEPMKCTDNIPENPNGAGWNYSSMDWGDGTIRQGYYLGLLATEYRLLKDAGENVTGVLNELYYALNAINRLDLKAETELGEIYGLTNPNNLNGYFMRTDIPEGFADNWKNSSYECRCDESEHYGTNNAKGIDSTFIVNNPDGTIDTVKYTERFNYYQNVPSADQLSSLTVGLSLVYELLDDGLVQPTAADTPINLLTMTRMISQRLYNFLDEHKWMYIDVNGWPVNNGSADHVWSQYALKKWLQNMDYSVTSPLFIQRSYDMYLYAGKVLSQQTCLTGFGVNDPTPQNIADACDDVNDWVLATPTYFQMMDNLEEGVPAGPLNNQETSAYISQLENGDLFINPNSTEALWSPTGLFSNISDDLGDDGSLNTLAGIHTWWRALKPGVNSNKTIIANYAAASETWDALKFRDMAVNTKNHQIQLIAAVLQQHTPYISKSECEEFLNSISPTGSYKLSYENISCYPSNGWCSYDRWTSSADSAGTGFTGIFNNIDYMLFHNLYRIIYKDQLPAYKISEDCFCDNNTPLANLTTSDPALTSYYNEANQFINFGVNRLPDNARDHFNGTHIVLSNTSENIEPFFPNYLDLNIHVTQFLTSQLSIESNATLNVNEKYVLCKNSILSVGNLGIMNINKSTVTAKSNSTVNIHGTLNIKSGTKLEITETAKLKLWETGKIYIKDGATLEIGGSEFQHHAGAKIYMEGPNSKLILHKDITLFWQQDFEIVQLGAQHGQIIIDGPDVKIISTTNLSKINLIGKDKTKPFITLTDNSKLSHLNNNGTFIKIHHGTITLGENAKFDLKQPFYGAYLNVVSTKINGGFIFQDFSEILYSDFSNVPVTANLNVDNVGNLDILGCNFVQPNTLVSYPAALIKVTGRGFNIVNSTLNSSRSFGVQSSSLTLASSFNGSSITTPFTGSAITGFIGIQDVSNVEIYVNRSTITKCNKGISKFSGKLTVRCSDFNSNKQSNISVEDNCLLNLSSYSNAGYNKFMKTLIDRNIEFKTVPVPNLVAGYNYIEACLTPTNTLYGTINTTCTSCASIIASYCQWNTGLTNPGNISSLTNSIGFNYTTSTFPMALKPKSCPTDPILPGDPNGGGTAGKMGNSLDTITPVIFSQHFQDSILIDELIYQAASKISLISEDSSDNILAVNLLDELFTSNLSKTDSLNNFYLNYGLDLMKMAVEESFRKEELSPVNNSTSFDPYVAKYVDAMMYMTDSIIDSSNYEMQYILEIDKAHLMRLTGHPEIGLNILTELENCGLDSIAQANLNFWKQEYETDIIIKQIGQQFLDSTISIDTSNYINPVLAVNNYSFGSIINDVNDIQYTNCDFFTKELYTGTLSDQIAVYPNPATTQFDIAIKSPAEGLGTIKIVQMDGKTICERQFEMSFNHNEKVESANWPSGVYTLIVTLPNKEQKRIKILIQ